jgi:hypothetical protein
MNKNLVEILEHRTKKIEEKQGKKGKIVRAKVKWQQADSINQNCRLYPMAILQREAQKIQDKIDKGETVWGHAYHPADSQGRTVDISHRWDKVWSEGKNFYGEITILPTPHGQMIQELLRHGKLSMSSRGTGTLITKTRKPDEKEYSQVSDDFSLRSPGDFVISGSVKGAELIKVIESQKEENLITEERVQELEEMLEVKKEDKKEMSLDDFNDLIETYLYANFMTSDHYRPNQFEQFKKDHEENYRRLLAERFLKEGKRLSKETIEKKADRFKPQARLSFKDLNISGATLEEQEKYKKSMIESGATERERRLFREAILGGYKGDFKSWREKYSKAGPARLSTKQLTEDEKEKNRRQNEVREKVKMNLIAGKADRKYYKKMGNRE